MAFSLSLGGAYKTVATQEQVEGLVAQGWVLASGGTADDTTALGEFPSYLEDFGAGSVNPTFRGEGLTGELQTSLGYLIKQEQPGLSKTDLDLIKTAFYNDELKSASTFVDISIVTELPAEPDETIIYLLSGGDGDPVDGFYISNAGDWIPYTPGDAFDVNYGSTRELALIEFAGDAAEVPNGTVNTIVPITAAICALAEAIEGFDDTNYDVTVLAGTSNTYNTGTGAWAGKFVVTHKTNTLDKTTAATATALTVTIANS